jgi:probable addiction module antidote protein
MIFATDNVNAFARKAGVDRTALYRGFKRKPRLDLVSKVLRGADFRLVVVDHPKRGSKSNLSKHFTRAFGTEKITLITKALCETFHAQENVAMFAKEANLRRETLYRAFTATHVPTLSTVLSFLKALGLRLAV